MAFLMILHLSVDWQTLEDVSYSCYKDDLKKKKKDDLQIVQEV